MEEEYVVKFKTKYDLDAVKAYNRFNLYSNLGYKIITVLAIVLIVLGIVINMSVALKVSSIVIGVAWILEVLIMPNVKAKSVMKSSRISKDAVVETEFKEANIFMISKKKDDIIGTSVIKYEDVYKICNTKDYIYVYTENNHAILCSKKNMKGNYKKFSKFIKEKVGKKYKGK